MDAPNVSEFHRVDESPAQFIRFLERQAASNAVAPVVVRGFDPVTPQRVLEVGSGIGVDARTLLDLVDPSVKLVGVDASWAMVRDAIRRTESTPNLVFGIARGEDLPFADSSFDACYCARTLQHIARPLAALVEMRRVLKPNSPIVVIDVDHGTTTIDSEHPDVLERVLRATNRQLSPNVGRSLRRLLLSAGFSDVDVAVTTRVFNDPMLPSSVMALLVDQAATCGAITSEEGQTLLDGWQRDEREGTGFAIALRFVARARA